MEKNKDFWNGFNFACQMLEDMGYCKSSTHPYNIADCLKGKMNRLPKSKLRKNTNGPLMVKWEELFEQYELYKEKQLKKPQGAHSLKSMQYWLETTYANPYCKTTK